MWTELIIARLTASPPGLLQDSNQKGPVHLSGSCLLNVTATGHIFWDATTMRGAACRYPAEVRIIKTDKSAIRVKYRSVQSCTLALWWHSLFLFCPVASLLLRAAIRLHAVLCGLRLVRGIFRLGLSRCG